MAVRAEDFFFAHHIRQLVCSQQALSSGQKENLGRPGDRYQGYHGNKLVQDPRHALSVDWRLLVSLQRYWYIAPPQTSSMHTKLRIVSRIAVVFCVVERCCSASDQTCGSARSSASYQLIAFYTGHIISQTRRLLESRTVDCASLVSL